MSYKVSILQKEKSVEGLYLKYSIYKSEEIIDNSIHTTFDIEVEKVNGNRIESAVCKSVSTDINIVSSILDLLFKNDVLPETLTEVMEECLELV